MLIQSILRRLRREPPVEMPIVYKARNYPLEAHYRAEVSEFSIPFRLAQAEARAKTAQVLASQQVIAYLLATSQISGQVPHEKGGPDA